MSSPGDSEVHQYPPTTAEWVTSPLPDHDELGHNPLEPVPEVKPSVRLSAALIIISGLVALASLIVQLYLAKVIALLGSPSVRASDWIAIVFPIATTIFPLVFAVGGVVRGITLYARVTRRSVVQVLQFASAGLALSSSSRSPWRFFRSLPLVSDLAKPSAMCWDRQTGWHWPASSSCWPLRGSSGSLSSHR